MLLTLASFILVLGVLIFVHELGHFMAAKAVGIGVPRFSIGFGPATPIRFRRGETEYLVSWIPFGGYVKMASLEEQQAMEGLEGGEVEQEFPPEKLLESKSLAARMLVISAGVIMNALFAWAAYSGLLLAYGQAEDPTVTISRINADALSPEAIALADVPAGSRVLQVNGQAVDSWNDIIAGVLDTGSEQLQLTFDGGVDPIVLDIPGNDAEQRTNIARAMIPLWEPRIEFLSPGRPAEEAGMQAGDLITHINGEALASWDGLVSTVERSVGQTLQMTIDRQGEIVELEVAPTEEEVTDPVTGDSRKAGRIGVGPKLETRRTELGLTAAITEGGRQTLDSAGEILAFLKGMVLGQVSPKNLGGPLLIGQASGQFARAGVVALVTFMAFLSMNLAILNLLPIPVLDGGHLVFLIIEGLRGGKPLPLNLRLRLTQIGLYMLMALMAFAVINDVLRIFG